MVNKEQDISDGTQTISLVSSSALPYKNKRLFLEVLHNMIMNAFYKNGHKIMIH